MVIPWREYAEMDETDNPNECKECGEDHEYFPKVIDHTQLRGLDKDGRRCERCDGHMYYHKWALMDINGFVIYCDQQHKMDM